MLKPVTITISGEHNSGRTTLASLITDALTEAGYEHVHLKDQPPLSHTDKPEFRVRFEQNRKEREINVVVETKDDSKPAHPIPGFYVKG
jgi:hypothetical protein